MQAIEADICVLMIFLREDGSLLLLISGSQVDRRKEPRMNVVAAPWVSRLLHFFFIPGFKKKKKKT